ncbi:MAG TPA: hypothetical protein VGQ85_01190, partial [Candidatus Limnocylindrales bacterium]|nr:hypothetical protein [Candidatus Limnocylindrales bacterium]
MTQLLRFSVLVCLAGVLGGCGAVVSRAGASPVGASPVTASSASTSAEPTAVAPIGSPTSDEAEAIRFRTSFGLQADLAYVRFVAGSPLASNRDFGVPLLPSEVTELNARAANADAIVGAIQRYAAAHADEFAGVYLDQEGGGGAVTTMWTGHLEEHAAAIRAMVRPDARIAFRAGTFTYRDLRALQDRIGADWDWMRASGIAPMGLGVNIIANRLEIDVSSANPDAAGLVASHYAVADGMLTVISDGTGAALLPRGTVKGRVVDSLGKPP